MQQKYKQHLDEALSYYEVPLKDPLLTTTSDDKEYQDAKQIVISSIKSEYNVKTLHEIQQYYDAIKYLVSLRYNVGFTTSDSIHPIYVQRFSTSVPKPSTSTLIRALNKFYTAANRMDANRAMSNHMYPYWRKQRLAEKKMLQYYEDKILSDWYDTLPAMSVN